MQFRQGLDCFCSCNLLLRSGKKKISPRSCRGGSLSKFEGLIRLSGLDFILIFARYVVRINAYLDELIVSYECI